MNYSVLIKKDIDTISKKYQYDNKLSQLLSIIVESMITYYGEEMYPTIIEALSTTYIHYQKENENPTDYLSRYFGEYFEYNNSIGQLNSISNLSSSGVTVKKIIYLSKDINYIDLQKDDVFSDWCLQALIHEINHAIKNVRMPQILTENSYKQFNGLNETIFKTDTDPYTMISDDWNEIEEALNTLQEYELFEIITGRSAVEASIFQNTAALLDRLFEIIPKLKETMQNNEFNSNNHWLDIIGKENARKLEELFLYERNNPGKCSDKNGTHNKYFDTIVKNIQDYNCKNNKEVKILPEQALQHALTTSTTNETYQATLTEGANFGEITIQEEGEQKND